MPPTKRKDQPGPSEPKRTRFASPAPPRDRSASVDGPDEFLEDDLQQGAARAKQKSKRQLKDTEGYGSDSSNDEEGIVPSRRPKEEEEDVDMFGDVEEKKDKGKEKKKDFMDLDDIEGQELDKGKEVVSDSDSDSDAEIAGDEATERKRRKEKALGNEVTGFNMKEEMEEGKFTADGETYVENAKDEGDKHDVWLTDVDKDVMKKARRAHKLREKQEAEREAAEARGVGKEREMELMTAAVDLMERGETVLEALQRLGKEAEDKRKKEDQGKKKSWAERQKERKAMMAQDEMNKDAIDTANPFTNLTNVVSGLTTIGHLDVYSLSRESLQRMLPASAATQSSGANGAAAPRPPPDNRQFQYRFSMTYIRSLPEGQRPVEREIFGPFPTLALAGWKASGAFGPNCQNIELRKAGDESAPWGSWDSIVAT